MDNEINKYQVQFNLPLEDNNGLQLDNVHTELQESLASTYGGFTMHHARGVWMNEGKLYNESVAVYTIAMTVSEYFDFKRLALKTGEKARQEAVYMVDPLGKVDIFNV